MSEQNYRDNDPFHDDWAKRVKERDHFTCVICEKQGVKLESHHMNSFDWCIEERYALSNGVTLCLYHHKRFHEIYGFGKNSKYQFKQFKKTCDLLKKIAKRKSEE